MFHVGSCCSLTIFHDIEDRFTSRANWMLYGFPTDFLGLCICANVWVGCVFSTNEMFHCDDFKKMDTDNPLSGSWFCIAIGGLLLVILAVTFLPFTQTFSSLSTRMVATVCPVLAFFATHCPA